MGDLASADEGAVPAALRGPELPAEPPSVGSRGLAIAFVVVLLLLALVAMTPAGDALGQALGAGSGGCGGG